MLEPVSPEVIRSLEMVYQQLVMSAIPALTK